MDKDLERYIDNFSCDMIGFDIKQAARHTGKSEFEIEHELENAGWDRPLYRGNKWHNY